MTTDHQAVYDDAELLAIQIVREAAAEWSSASDYSLSTLINDHLLAFQEQHGTNGAIVGLVVALSRMSALFLAGRPVSREGIPGFLDDFELGKVEQHQNEKQPARLEKGSS